MAADGPVVGLRYVSAPATAPHAAPVQYWFELSSWSESCVTPAVTSMPEPPASSVAVPNTPDQPAALYAAAIGTAVVGAVWSILYVAVAAAHCPAVTAAPQVWTPVATTLL